MRRLEKVSITFDLFDHGFVVDGFAITHFHVSGFWQYWQRNGQPLMKRSYVFPDVDGRVNVPRMHKTDIAAFQRVDAIATI